MTTRWPLTMLILGLPFISRASVAHDHTRQAFARQRAVAQLQAQQQSEPAPRAAAGEKSCRLMLELTVGDVGKPVAGLVRITNRETGKPLLLGGEIQRDALWHAVGPGVVIELPQARLTVEAMVGLHTEKTVREIDLTGKADSSLALPLQPFYDPAARGLSAGNTHVHLMKLSLDEAFRYLRTVPQADGLDVVYVSYLAREPEDRDYVTNRFTDGDLGRLSREGVLFGNGQEHRHNFGPQGEGYGHVMLLNILRLIEPVSIGPGIMKKGTDGIPLQRGIKTARGDGATVIWCHNKFGHEDIPNWVAGLVQAQNIHDGGSHGSYEETFYRYLNAGMKVPFSTGTDWFIYDFNRVYVPVSGELTSRKWLESLASGKSYITNGPFLEFEADGKGAGDTIDAIAGQDVRITARGIGRGNFERLELIHNGTVIHTVDAGPASGHHQAAMEFKLKVTEPGWVALRIPTGAAKNEFDKPLFAHTSPIYIDLAGKHIFRADVARGLLAEMEASRDAVAGKALFADEQEKDAVLSVYRESIGLLKQRIGE
ncbi:MAG: CehA/McbA family metallohydrolase [Planctomycetaceae bacterium]|nr:CehA/McbA family metallohydrolase [Planctomycetaceae bacterium]